MKKLLLIAALAVGGWAADYSAISTDELLKMRGTAKTQVEQNAMHAELTKREKTMTTEQAKSFHTYPPENRTPKYKNQPNSQGQGNGPADGQGMGANRPK